MAWDSRYRPIVLRGVRVKPGVPRSDDRHITDQAVALRKPPISICIFDDALNRMGRCIPNWIHVRDPRTGWQVGPPLGGDPRSADPNRGVNHA